jgi:glycosyltransferase involved in cell wall biosynthesis
MKDDQPSRTKPTVAHLIASNIMGGVEIATLRLTALTSGRFHHIAFCVEEAAALRDLFQKQGTETAAYKLPTPSLRHGLRFYRESNVIAKQLRALNVDIVHFADVFAGSRCSVAALLAHTRTVCHVRLSHPMLDWRDRISLLPVGHYVFVSEEARRTFALHLDKRQTRVIYDAVEIPPPDDSKENAAVRREFGIPDGSHLVGSVVRVAPQKDFETLAAGAAKVLERYPDTRFLIVGDHSSDESLRIHLERVTQRLHELGIADSFVFTGYRTDVPRLIGAMDICVLCTHREGFPLSILEFMAKRKPVVATAVGGVPEIIKHGETGYLHRHLDSDELANAIISLIESPQEAARIATTGYELVRRDYSRDKYAATMSGMYFDLLGRNPDAGLEIEAAI